MRTPGYTSKGNQLKPYEIQKKKQQKSLQKFKINASQYKDPYQVYLSKNKKLNNSQTKNKSYSNLKSATSTNANHLTMFQKKIRQAIEARYLKSQINDFKYQKINQQTISARGKLVFSKKMLENQQIDSQQSENIKEMIQFIYLKNEQFMNIHQYHGKKIDLRSQSKISNENMKKRDLKRTVPTFDLSGQSSAINESQKNNEIYNQLNSLSPKNTNQYLQSQLYISNINQSILNKSTSQKRKSLTSRQITKNNNDTGRIEIESKQDIKAGMHITKDTFKLKNVQKYLKNNDTSEENQKNMSSIIQKQQDNQKSGRSLNNKRRRYLLPKNQHKLKTIQTQTSQHSEPKFIVNNIVNKTPKKQTKQITSLRKIQTQIIDNTFNESKYPIYNKTTKNRTKFKSTKANFTSNFRQTGQKQKIHHSTSQQKWKLQEISFKFKPIDGQKMDIQMKQMNSFLQQKQKALKLGLSLQKAYEKLLSGRKAESKQTNFLNNKKTIIAQQNTQIFAYEPNIIYEEKRQISKNKRRRKLRLRTQADQIDKIQPIVDKNSGRNIQRNMNSFRIQQSDSKQSLGRSKQRKQFLINLGKKNKIQRFSTIN